VSLPPLPPPTWVNLESTLGCNLECTMCGSFLSGVTKQRKVMSPALLARVRDQVLPTARDLSLTVAGEPFMTPKLGTFVDLAEQSQVSLQLNSNATLIKDSELLGRLLRRASVVKFSIDGATKPTYEAIRIKADFDRVLDNVRLVVRTRDALPREQRPRLVLCMVLMRSNVHELTAMVDLATDLGLDRLEVAHVTAFTDAIDAAEALRHWPDEADQALRAARDRADARGLRTHLPPLMSGERLPVAPRTRARLALSEVRGLTRTRLRRLAATLARKVQEAHWARHAGGRVGCHFLNDGVFVTIGGDVAPCPMPGRPIVGNLLRDDFDTIWNGETLTAMRQGLIDGEPFDCCAHCSQNPDGHVPGDPQTVRPNHGLELA
jgi:MoaA/NifB/PqqE/SkfB family radical SAM enzyme